MHPSGTIPNRFLRLRQVKDLLGLSKSAIYARIGQGTFPKPVSLGGRSVAWIESEVAAWMNARVDASRGQSAASAA
jgi:prophage regulatory protein